MWILKLRLVDDKGIYEWRAKKFNVKLYAYRLSHYRKGRRAYLSAAMLMEASLDNKNNFINDLRKDKKVITVERKDDFFTCLSYETLDRSKKRGESFFYSPSIIYVKPAVTDKDGELWEIASWNRKDLEKVIKAARKLYKGKVLSFKEKKLNKDDVQIYSFSPKLTDKQKKAYELAKDSGYYDFPRKITLSKLAKLMKVSYTTYQFHLRKAERKLLSNI